MTIRTFVFFSVILILSPFALAKDHKSNTPTQIQFIKELSKSKHLVLGVFEGGVLGQYGKAIDEASSGGLKHAIDATEFKASAQSTQLITAPQNSGYQQILLVGLGNMDQGMSELEWQNIGGAAAQKAISSFKSAPAMAFDVAAEHAAQIAFGAKLGSYYFDKYFTDGERKKHQSQISIVTPQVSEAQSLFNQELDPIADATWFTRDISNEPANVIYPQSFVERWKEHFKGVRGVKVRVLDEDDMLDMGMGAIYGVGRGSKRPPRMMIVEYFGGDKDAAPVAIVGKGITFDTGGISIKSSNNMWNMKFDMSGAASSMGTLYALAKRKAKVNAVAIAALAENMPDGNAQRPGDVVTSMSGKTIQIRSTDAEGRLVLADGVYYADTKYKPALLVDLATLTGSAARALGKDYAAFFSRHDDLAPKFIATGKATGEEVWPLPLNKNHFKAVENSVADVMNSGPSAPGASAGAAFIGTFIRETTPWVHLDIAGVAWTDKSEPLRSSPGSTSFGIRLLNQYIKENFEK